MNTSKTDGRCQHAVGRRPPSLRDAGGWNKPSQAPQCPSSSPPWSGGDSVPGKGTSPSTSFTRNGEESSQPVLGVGSGVEVDPDDPHAAAGAHAAVQFRSELDERGIGGQAPEEVRHAVTSGQDVLRTLILSAEDRRRFFIHPRCTRTVEAFQNYRTTERAEGIYDPRPDPNPSNHTYSHGTDQARYLCWTLRRMFALAGYEG